MERNKIIGFALGPILSAMLGLITVPIIAWIFNPEDIGRMSIFLVTISFILLFSVLGLDQAYVREYHEVEDKQQLLLNCALPGFLVLIIVSFPIILWSNDISSYMYQTNDPLLVWITLLVFYISYISRFFSLILRMEERGWAYSISQIFPKILQILILCILSSIAIKKEFMHLQFVTLIPMIGVMLFFGWYTKSEWLGALNKKLDFLDLKKLLNFGVPLIFSGLAFWGLTSTSTLAIKNMSSLEELAIYSIANSFAAVGILFQSIFSIVWAPTVYKWLSQKVDMTIVDKISRQALAVVCLIVTISGSLSWLLDYFLPSQYDDVKTILLCMLIQPLLYTLSEITCIGIAIQRKTIYTIGIVFFAMLINIGICYMLVPTLGAKGAAIANAGAFTVFFVLRTEVSAKLWKSFPRKELYSVVLIILLLSILDAVQFIPWNYIAIIWSVVLMVVIYYFNDSLMSIKNYLFK